MEINTIEDLVNALNSGVFRGQRGIVIVSMPIGEDLHRTSGHIVSRELDFYNFIEATLNNYENPKNNFTPEFNN